VPASRSAKRKSKKSDTRTSSAKPATKSTVKKAIKKPVLKASNKNHPEVGHLRKILTDALPQNDRRHFTDESLTAIADTFLSLAETRKAGQVHLRAFNPALKKEGYTSRHTIIMVVNDDMPFLVDSIMGELTRQNLTVHLLLHPILRVARNEKNELQHLSSRKQNASGVPESWMYIEIDETPDTETLKAIEAGLHSVLEEVRVAVADWHPMRAKVIQTITELPRNEAVGLPAGEREETAAFLAWMEADNFTLLGMRDYRIAGKGHKAKLEVAASGLGVLRDPVSVLFFSDKGEGEQPADIYHFLERKHLALVTRTHKPSVVHRTTPMDAILIKRFDEKGEVIGERLFVGLFTSSAYTRPARDIPLIRGKLDHVLDTAGFDPVSYDGKALRHILENYPRGELFQIDAEGLYDTALGILSLQERQRLAVFVRHDTFNRFVNCLIFVPRERYSTALRKVFQQILQRTFHGTSVDYNVKITNDALAQVFMVVRTGGALPAYDREALERELEEASRGWQGRLSDELVATFGENKGLRISDVYADAFPSPYRDSVETRIALADIAFVSEAIQHNRLGVNLYRPPNASARGVNLKWYSPAHALSLGDIMPLMQDMGINVRAMHGPYEVKPQGSAVNIWIHDCVGEARTPLPANIDSIKLKFEECLMHVWSGDAEADGYNQLVLIAGLGWRDIVVLRATGKYLRQARLPYSEATIIATLCAHPEAARLLVNLFVTRHSPDMGKDRAKAAAAIEKRLFDYLRDVKLLDQDRILRRFLNVIQNTLRTNFFQPGEGGLPKSYVSFKLDSKKLDHLPLPRPHVEVFVYSPRMEAIHLRGGKVARGGIRWSDRREDFRTEVLGLMKAQQVKNTVIVPVGSKGGFIVKSTNVPDMAKEGVACYQTMMRGLLDITDNRVNDKIVPPKNVVRHDGDDPYLVVAADKGTAKFSDIANAISLEYGFWLGDAFASGGSAGYDHKGMGITARGAWEAVKRHFREMDKNIQEEPFTVIGIGDMMGDVFGNGMLLSKHIQLIGAFNHKHIFIDPTPDIAKSFAERQRLFNLPASQWTDYNKKLISKGGGIFNRDVKTIPLSREIRDLLEIREDEVSPDALIRAMLKAEVELLYFGGIGTYIKAAEETDNDAGDRANDALRINADELRAKVVGEGANLGMTQRARIAFAQKGGRLNTDAIDNSAGVDTSDHEVNIKILLDPVVRGNKLTLAARNQLLARMTDNVAKLVLRDNYLQTLALSVAAPREAELMSVHTRLMHRLERKGLLNRVVEYLPDDDEISQRMHMHQGLTRPEMAVLLAYAKSDLYEDIIASALPDDPGLENELFFYFPDDLREKYAGAIRQHGLRREIIATCITNSLINRGGAHIMQLLQDRTGRNSAEIAGAYAVLQDVFDLRGLWGALEKLDNKVSSNVLTELYVLTSKMIERATPWYVMNTDPGSRSKLVGKHRQAVDDLRGWMAEHEEYFISRDVDRVRRTHFTEAGVPEKLIHHAISLRPLAHVPEIIGIAEAAGRSLANAADLYFKVEDRFQLFLLRNQARTLTSENPLQSEAVDYLIEDIYRSQVNLCRLILKNAGKNGKSAKSDALINDFIEAHGQSVQNYDSLTRTIATSRVPEFAMLNLALRQLLQWAHGG
jgi:glutamate dehydrogenase